MKNKFLKCALLLFIGLFIINFTIFAQCSVCTRSTEQLGEKPAGKINAGILYLAAAPLAIMGIIGVRWWKKNKPQA